MVFTNKAKVVKNKGDFYILSDSNYCYIIESSDELQIGEIITWDMSGTFFYNVTTNCEIFATMQYDGISPQSALECLDRCR